ncbi:outer membrane receptor protein involved in Fe transport [Pelomonas saccharophila]|uniref:Outer membrane receptor protein involved in Fe transport n=1 Tax=Roseateles saccharophilus TaxID=304 RepID=A0ABU1YTC0_ROSSA|nr:TonB-dependent receptor [Roseateles saccharophilus]MDR7272110.1 outer membrane receptor protein involved in Fe transport [Roseateles saccharophilus]
MLSAWSCAWRCPSRLPTLQLFNDALGDNVKHTPTQRARNSQITNALAAAALFIVLPARAEDARSNAGPADGVTQAKSSDPAAVAEASTRDANRTSADNRLSLDRTVVTGTGVARRKFDMSYAVSSISSSDIDKLGPLNTADLIGQMPGVQAEATGGEAQNIYRVRGIPNESNFFTLQEDGMLVYGENDGFFFKGDVMIRPDLMTQSVEVVRGGPAPIFADNAAAIVNLITRQGGEAAERGTRLTLGDTGLYRFDGFASGKLADRMYYAFGGFYRKHRGYRDNGFPSDTGGQVRLNIRHRLDQGEARFFAKVFDDRNVFLLPIPVADPRNPSKSLNPYIDYFKGTLNSPYLRNVQMLYPTEGGAGKATEGRDLSNGRHLRYFNTGVDLSLDLGGWRLGEQLRLTQGHLDFDALYSTVNPADGNAFAASFLNASRTVFGPGVSRLGYTFAGQTASYDPYAASGLVAQAGYRAIWNDFSSVSNDLRVTRDFELAGKHRLTAGLLLSRYKSTMNMRFQDLLLELAGKPRPLDLVAYDAGGNALGRVTDNGVLRYSSTLTGGESTVTQTSVYFADTWKPAEQTTLDFGARRSGYKGDGFSKLTARYDLGNGTTLADNSTLGFTGVNAPRSIDGHPTSWTVGVNQEITRAMGVYARASVAYRLPGEINVYTFAAPTTTRARQYEAGLKYSTQPFSAFATVFLSQFKPFATTVAEIDPATGTITNQVFIGNVKSPGVELEFSWRPLASFTLDGSATYAPAKSGNMVSAAGNQSLTTEGKLPIRQPKAWGNIRPAFNFAVADWQASAYARFNFTGRRYVDLQNTTALPAYQTLALGASASKGGTAVQLMVENATNAKGLTEGNPRADAVAGQGTADAIYGRPLFGRNVRLTMTQEW